MKENNAETKANNSGGDGPRRKTRVGSNTPGGRPKRVRINAGLTVKELAKKLSISEAVLIKHLYDRENLCRTLNMILDLNTARHVALDLGFEVVDGEA